MKKRYHHFALLLALILTLSLSVPTALAETSTPAPALSDYFSDRDLSGEWKEDKAVAIELTGDGASCDSSGVTVSGGTVTIAEAGTYVLTGELTGSVAVNVGDDDKVQLVLSGVTISPASGAAILVENADKVFVTLAEGTENALSCAAFDEESDIDAAVFARDDITFNGTGSLTIASGAHGIVGKDDVKFASGSYTITAEKRGIDANDSVRIAGGSFTIAAGKDGIRAKHSEDTAKGYVIIFDGSFTITTASGAAGAPAHSQGTHGFGQQASSADEGSSTSAKGIKASGDLTILGGTFAIDAEDDGLHADQNLTIGGGSFTIASGDDGMHADAALTLTGGEITVSQSYEGLEGQTIVISGGDVTVTASDDGLNAAGGNDQSGYGYYDRFSGDSTGSLAISGGTLYVNAAGDGLDSNGDLTVTGGVIVVSGPTNSGNGALDYGERGTATITGGALIAAGASGMAENFGSASTQVSALVTLSGQGGEIRVTDASGSVILSGTVDKGFDCVVVSCPEMTVGESYTVSCGAASTAVEITDTIVGSGMGMGGFGGHKGGRGGQFQGGQFQNGQPGMMGDDRQPPQGGTDENQIPSSDATGAPQFPQGGMQPPQDGMGGRGRGGK